MPRIARVTIPGLPHHIVQRGNHGQNIFFSDDDKVVYLSFLKKYSTKHHVKIIAYCLMDNHVHILAVPKDKDSLSLCFQETNKGYTQFINARTGWKGTMWEGRFKSYPMDNNHLVAAMRYVERNPVKAGMVERADEYMFSSARYHVGKRRSDPIVQDYDIGIQKWGEFLLADNDPGRNKELEGSLNTGRPLGDRHFVEKLEATTKRLFTPNKRGRPRLRKLGSIAIFVIGLLFAGNVWAATFTDDFSTANDVAAQVGTEVDAMAEVLINTDIDETEVIDFEAGSSQYGTVDSAAFTSYPASMTAWVQLESTHIGAIVLVLDKDVTNAWTELIVNGTFEARSRSNAEGIDSATGTTTPELGRWYHVAAVYASTTSRKIYVNGILEATNTATNTPTGYDRTSIGMTRDSTPSTPFDGLIDDVRIFNVALTDTEVAGLYHANIAPGTAPVGHYKMNTGSGNTLTDDGSNGFDLDMTGHAGTWTTIPTDASGYYTTRARATSTNLLDGLSATSATSFGYSIDKKPGGREIRVQFSDDNFTTIKNSNGDDLTNAGAYSFDGVNDVITVSGDAAIDDAFDGGGTWAGWVYPKSDGEGNVGNLMRKNNNHVIWLDNETSGHVGLNFYMFWSGTDGQWNVDPVIPINQWTHIAVTYDADATGNTPTIYLNGSPTVYTTTVGPPTGTRDSDSGGSLTLGNRLSATDQTFDGLIDDVRIYKGEALTATQVWELYSQNKDGGTLDGHWPLDNTTTSDTSGNGNDGSVSGATHVTDWYRLPVLGEVLGDTDTLSFDGSNDYIDIGSAANYESDTTGSITGWFYAKDRGGSTEIIGYGGGNVATPGFFVLRNDDEKLRVLQNSDGEGTYDSVETTASVPFAEWTHFALTSSGSVWKLYINSVDQALTVVSGGNNGNWFGDTSVAATDKHMIGAFYFDGSIGSSSHFRGYLANIAVWSDVRTDAEILAEFEKGYVDSAAAGLRAYWPMNEGTGTDIDNAEGTTANDGDMSAVPATWVDIADRPTPASLLGGGIDISSLSYTSTFYYRAFPQSMQNSPDRPVSLTSISVEYTASSSRRVILAQ